MSPLLEAIAGLHWGWKITGSFLAGLASSLPIIISLLSGPVDEVKAATLTNAARIEQVEATTAKIQADFQLVRCWVKNQIQDTDPSVCLVLDDGR